MDGSATFRMKKSSTNMNVLIMSTASGAQDARAGACSEVGRLRVAVMFPSLGAPVTGESSGREHRPADLGALPGGVRLGERALVVLAAGAVHADGPLGHHGAEQAVG